MDNNLYTSRWANLPTEADLVAEATPAKKGWSKKRKYAIVGGGLAAVLIPTAAWAAITLFGFGNFSADAAAAGTLTVDNVALTNTLVPGGTAGTKGIVHNPNDYPIKVLHVLVQDSSVKGTGNGCDQNSLTLLGTAGQAYPTADGGGTAHKQDVADQVTIPAGGAAWVTVPQTVKQNASATVACGVTGKFAVAAESAATS